MSDETSERPEDDISATGVDDIWDETASDHTDSDTTGKTVNDLRQLLPASGTLAQEATVTNEIGQPSNDSQTLYALLANDSLANLTLSSNSLADVLDKIRRNSDLTSDFSATATATDKNTDGEIRDGVWSDSTKAAGANLDAAVSSRSSHSWDPDGVIPSSGTVQTDPADPTTGTLSADGTEQTVFTMSPATAGTAHYYLDLANMASGDTVVVREKADVDNGGTFTVFSSTTYSDAQTESVVGPSTDFLAHSTVPFRVTLEQTGGTNRSYPFAHGVIR